MNRGPLPDSHGQLIHVTQAAPAVATAVTIDMPDNSRTLFICCQLNLDTDANAANRLVFIAFFEGVTEYLRIYANRTEIANEIITYNFCNAADRSTAINNQLTVNIPPNIYLPKTGAIQIGADNLQAGDQFSATEQLVMRWMEP